MEEGLLLKEPLWLAGLSVNALLTLLARRPKEFRTVYVDRYTVVEVPREPCKKVLQKPLGENSKQDPQFEVEQGSAEPHVQSGGRRTVWEPTLRTQMRSAAPPLEPEWTPVVTKSQLRQRAASRLSACTNLGPNAQAAAFT